MSTTKESVRMASPAPSGVGVLRSHVTLSQLVLPLVIVVTLMVFTVLPSTSGTFPSSANARAVLTSTGVLAICAMGLVIPMVAGHFDLSVGTNVGATSIVAAGLFSSGAGPVVSLGGAIVVGTLIGAVNGFLVAAVGINSFITTLGMSTLLGGLVLAYTDGQSIIQGIPSSVLIASRDVLGVPLIACFVAIVGLIVWYALSLTVVGREMQSIGSSQEAARLVGIPVQRRVFGSFVLAGVVCGIGGSVQLSAAGVGNPQVGPSFLLPAFAAAFLGATVSRWGFFNIGGTLLAVFFVAVTVSGLVLAGVPSWVEQVFQGAVLIAAVALSTVSERRRRGSR